MYYCHYSTILVCMRVINYSILHISKPDVITNVGILIHIAFNGHKVLVLFNALITVC